MIRRASGRAGVRMAMVAGATAVLAIATPRADPGTASRLEWLIEGEVRTAARLGQTLFVGGLFTRVAPSANVLPPVYRLSAATGQVVSALPALTGRVTRILPDGAGGYFLAGEFTTSAPVRRHLVHVTAAGAVDPAFDASLVNAVRGVARVGDRLFLIGDLPVHSGSPAIVVAVSAATGALEPWPGPLYGALAPAGIVAGDDRLVVVGTESVPMVQTGVAIALDAATGGQLWRAVVAGGGVGHRGSAWTAVRAGADVFVAHSPTPANGGLSRLALSTGVVDPAWNPGVSPAAVAVDGSRVLAAGVFDGFQGFTYTGVLAIDRATGATGPLAYTNGAPTHLVVRSAGRVFVAGEFTTVNAYPRHRLFEVDVTGPVGVPGQVTPWVADVGPDAVFALAGDADTLVVSSSVAASGGMPRRNAAAFDLSTGALLPWQAQLPSTYGVTFIGGDAAQLYITEGLDTLPYDTTTGARLSGLPLPRRAGLFADADGFYTVSLNDCCGTREPHILRRHGWDGAEDPSWRPTLPLPLAAHRHIPPLSLTADARAVYVAHASAGLAALDQVSGRVRWAIAQPATGVAVTGQTLYALGAPGVMALDTVTGRSVAFARPGSVPSALAIADGRVVVSEATALGGQRLAVYGLDGTPITWNPGFERSYPSLTRSRLVTLGDTLVAGGALGMTAPQALQGLAVFDLAGALGPSALRARPVGPSTEFAWNPPASAPAGGYVLEAGVAPGQTVAALPLGPATRFSAAVPPGTFFVRVRSLGAGGGSEAVSNEILVTGGCAAPPPMPAGFSATLLAPTLDRVRFSWTLPDALVSSYALVAESAPGLNDIATIAVAGGSDAHTHASAIPAGTYYVRLRATNACGASAFTPALRLTVGGGGTPSAPYDLRLWGSPSVNRTLTWTAPAGTVTGYVLEAGTGPGLADLAAVPLGPVASFAIPPVPAGAYHLRVRAVNAAGTGPPSADVVLHVP